MMNGAPSKVCSIVIVIVIFALQYTLSYANRLRTFKNQLMLFKKVKVIDFVNITVFWIQVRKKEASK